MAVGPRDVFLEKPDRLTEPRVIGAIRELDPLPFRRANRTPAGELDLLEDARTRLDALYVALDE